MIIATLDLCRVMQKEEYKFNELADRDEKLKVENTVDSKSLTFRQIHDHAKKCGAFLIEMGVTKGDFVALCAPNVVEFTTAMFGIMSSGAVVAPCNPKFSEGEMLQQFQITEPKYVIAHEDAVPTLIKVQSKLPFIKEIFVIGESGNLRTFDSIIQSQHDLSAVDKIEFNTEKDLALIPYSSGTTGMPKAVMLTHRNLVSAMVAYLKHSRWPVDQPGTCGYMDRPMYHVGGFGCVLLSLSVGMKLVMAQEVDFETTLKAVDKYKVTHLMTLPPIMIQLVNSEDCANYDTSSLKYITGGGASMSPDILIQLSDKFHVTVAPAYGMTEAGSISMSRNARETLSSVGYITTTVEVKIADLTTGDECKTGERGEIVIRGPQVVEGNSKFGRKLNYSRSTQVTPGYFKNPEATNSTIDAGGWFHTGDIGYLDEKHLLYIVDRLKEVIKYKGTQVAPAELECVILKHPKVADVGVVGIPHPVDCELPKAFVVKKDTTLTKDEVDDIVRDHLADYKQLRGGVEFVESIPRSELGKIMRNQLKKMAGVAN